MDEKIPRVEFKSTPDYYHKERSGLKPNTVRKIDKDDVRFKLLRNGCQVIVITNALTKQSFKRYITDYTQWEHWAIISWDAVNLP